MAIRGVPRLQWAILVGRCVVDFYAQLGRVAADDLGQFLVAVKLEVLANLKAIAERCGKHAAAGRRADHA